MSATPDFLDQTRPEVPDLVVARGVTPFHLPGRPVRGRLVRLGPLAEALLSRHHNHPAVTRLAGGALALAASLSTALKFRGSFSFQVKGDGPVRMLLADCTEAGALRGYARADAPALAAVLAGSPEPNARELLGSGYMAFTVDQGPDADRHQGIVAIEGDTLADMAAHYFNTSEQLDCRVRLACGRTDEGWRASALVLERVATEGGHADSLPPDDPTGAWQTATVLAGTVTDAELLDDALAPETLLFRLFHGDGGVAADRPRVLAYGCRCSRARLAGILETFGGADLDHMNVDGAIVMTCEFCNVDFRFPRDSIRAADASGATT